MRRLSHRPYLYTFTGEGGGTGGAPPAPPADAQTGQNGGGGAGAPPAGTGAPAERTDAQTTGWPEWDGKVDSLPEPIKAELHRLRSENAKGRVGAKTQAAREAQARTIEAVREMLGDDAAKSVADALGEPPVDARSQQQVEADAVREAQQAAETAKREQETAQAAARAAQAEAAVLRAGVRLGNVDADALLDSRDFAATLAKVDVADVNAVQEHVKAYTEQHPRFLTRAVGTSSADPAAGSGQQGRTRTVMSIAEAAEKAYASQAAR